MISVKHKSYQVPGTSYRVRGMAILTENLPGLVPLAVPRRLHPLVGNYKEAVADHAVFTRWFAVHLDLIQDQIEVVATTYLGKFAYSPIMYEDMDQFMDEVIHPEILKFVDESANR